MGGRELYGDIERSYNNNIKISHLKVSATLQDSLRVDHCSASCFYKNPYKPYIFQKLNNSRFWI